MTSKFANTVIGSWLKVFISAMILNVMNCLAAGATIYSIDYKQIINAAVISLLPVIYNYFNKAYPLYGKNKL